ncbi:hypothetical protein BDR07DRAFT_1379292 [Suillus spraguei]|nr:hypothetical protein BDR07DRAFT_1379292 [Suillus spraguei]
MYYGYDVLRPYLLAGNQTHEICDGSWRKTSTESFGDTYAFHLYPEGENVLPGLSDRVMGDHAHERHPHVKERPQFNAADRKNNGTWGHRPKDYSSATKEGEGELLVIEDLGHHKRGISLPRTNTRIGASTVQGVRAHGWVKNKLQRLYRRCA